jgi:hypothetical protein
MPQRLLREETGLSPAFAVALVDRWPPRATTADGRRAGSRARSYSAPKSGRVSEPSAASSKPGFQPISQACPSGSVKYPA